MRKEKSVFDCRPDSACPHLRTIRIGMLSFETNRVSGNKSVAASVIPNGC